MRRARGATGETTFGNDELRVSYCKTSARAETSRAQENERTRLERGPMLIGREETLKLGSGEAESQWDHGRLPSRHRVAVGRFRPVPETRELAAPELPQAMEGRFG